MVYLNASESSNFTTRDRDAAEISVVRATMIAAQFVLVFTVMLIVALALIAHGVWREMAAEKKRRPPALRQGRARYVPAYPAALA